MICPLMSRIPTWITGLRPDFSDLVEINCKGKDCALWVKVERAESNCLTISGTGSLSVEPKTYIERCGLIQ